MPIGQNAIPPIEELVADGDLCGEGPVWDEIGQRLLWNDNSSSLVFQYSPQTGVKSVLSSGLMASGIALHRDGSLVLAGSTGLHLWRGQDDYWTILASHEGEALFFNDILADAAGRLYAGTLYWGENGMEKHGKLYLIDLNGSARVVDEGIGLANGLGLSPDNRILYFSDSSERKIYAYDVQLEDGSLINKRVFVDVPHDEGIPDGLTVDGAGNVWSAQWYGGQVVAYSPEGTVMRRIGVPAKQTSSLAFGGRGLQDLYITSAGEAWPSDLAPAGYDFEAGPVGGSLYRVRLDIAGKTEHRVGIELR